MEFIPGVFSTIWQLMNIEMQLGNFTITLAQVFLFTIIFDLAVIAVFKYLFG